MTRHEEDYDPVPVMDKWDVLLLIAIAFLGFGAMRACGQTAPPGLELLRGPVIGVFAKGDVATVRVPRQFGTVVLPETVSVTLRLATCPGAAPAKLRWLSAREFIVEHVPAVLALPRPPVPCGLQMDAQAVAPLWPVPWAGWGPAGESMTWRIPYPAALRGTGLGVQVLVVWTDSAGVLRGLLSDVMGVSL
jgi:hypothetical protein